MKRKIQLLTFLLLTGCLLYSYADYPIVSHRYLADPAVLVHDGRVYLYCSNDDENPPTDDGGYQMSSIVCVSSTDLKNWTDHGIVFDVPRDASWSQRSWAPSVAERDGKFYLYFGKGGSAIGVAVSDSPTGPFTDPIGESLVDINTPGVLPAENIWVFDPMTFIDDDGQAYMYFGGNGEDNMRIIKLNDDMISLDGSATRFHVPYFFEAAWMHKVNDTYYFSYSTNPQNGIRIDYMTSDNPLTDFTYGGIVSPQPPSNNNNNHHGIFEFNGRWYEVYHNRYVAYQAGIPTVYRRNLCLDSIYHNPDGSIETMVNTRDGLPQLGFLNPYERIEAETMDDQYGIYTEECSEGGMNLSQIEHGDWTKLRGVDFGVNGPAAFTASVACEMKYGSTKAGAIEIRIDSTDGTLLGTVPVSYTGGKQEWKQETIGVDSVTGVHDVYFVFTGEDHENIYYFDYGYFTEKTGSHDLLGVNAVVDDYKIDTVSGNNTTKITVTAAYADGMHETVTTSSVFSFDPEGIVSIVDSTLTGIAYDTVAITASYNDSIDQVILFVKDLVSELTVSSLTADPSEIEVLEGGSQPVVITAEFADGHTEDVTLKVEVDNPDPGIATFTNGVITGTGEGEVDITVSYQGGEGDAQNTALHVSVTKAAGIWLEAECGEVGSLWNVPEDGNASNGEYVTISAGNNSTDAAPADPSGHITYTFDVTESGTYTLYCRVICPSPNDDSFWLSMDGGGFSMWNGIEGSSSWIWTPYTSTFDLSTGSHTLTIAYREDGARLDKLWLTSAPADISDLGGTAINCELDGLESQNLNNINLYPNPVSDELHLDLMGTSAVISIFSLDGKKVFSGRGKDQMTINTTDFRPGVYMLKIHSNGYMQVRELVKN